MHNNRELWAISSAGRASALQAECQQFDPVIAHQREAIRDGCFFSLRNTCFACFMESEIYFWKMKHSLWIDLCHLKRVFFGLLWNFFFLFL